MNTFPRLLKNKFILPILALVASLIILEYSNLDILIQDYFYNFDLNSWIIDKSEPVKRFIFYSGIKWALGALGLYFIFKIIQEYKKNKKILRPELIVVTSMIFIPLFISVLKANTNTYCPGETKRYGGKYIHVPVFSPYPSDFKPDRPGKCYPGGHSSGGFSLMSLGALSRDKKRKMLGVLTGLTLGWAMGLYQMMKGDHFFGHTVITMIIAWIMITGFEAIFNRAELNR